MKKVSRPIAIKLVLYILLYSSAITLIATGIQLYIEFRSDIGFIEKRLQLIETSYMQSVSKSAWDLNYDQIDSQMIGIMNLPDIVYLEIRLGNNETFKLGNSHSKNIIRRNYPIEYRVNAETKHNLGDVMVEATLSGVYNRIRNRVLIILGTQAIKTFLVSGFILFIIQLLVTRHLTTMANYTSELDLSRLDEVLSLNRVKSKGHEDELDMVVKAVNQMRQTIKQSANELTIKARMEGELNTAAKVQRSLLPLGPPEIEGYDIACMFRPAMEVSGDYYDFIPITEDRMGMVVADVSGKGVTAALYANMARVMLRDKALRYSNPFDAMVALNEGLHNEFQVNHFITIAYLELIQSESRVNYVNAGHEPVLLVRADQKRCLELKPRGYPISELHAQRFASRLAQDHVDMQSGDLVFIYTDGLTDLTNEMDEYFGDTRLHELLVSLSHLPAKEILNQMTHTLQLFQSTAQQTDDITMIALKKV